MPDSWEAATWTPADEASWAEAEWKPPLGVEQGSAPSWGNFADNNPLMGLRAGNPFAPGVSSEGTQEVQANPMQGGLGDQYSGDATSASQILAGLASTMGLGALGKAAGGVLPKALEYAPNVGGAYYGAKHGWKEGNELLGPVGGVVGGVLGGLGGWRTGQAVGSIAKGIPALQGLFGGGAAGAGAGAATTAAEVAAPAVAAARAAQAVPAATAAPAATASAAELAQFARAAGATAENAGGKVWMLLRDGKPISLLSPDQAAAAARAGEQTTWISPLLLRMFQQ